VNPHWLSFLHKGLETCEFNLDAIKDKGIRHYKKMYFHSLNTVVSDILYKVHPTETVFPIHETPILGKNRTSKQYVTHGASQ
jgi:hypothetical protein